MVASEQAAQEAQAQLDAQGVRCAVCLDTTEEGNFQVLAFRTRIPRPRVTQALGSL